MTTDKSVLLTHDTIKHHMLYNKTSVTALNTHDIHPERKARSNWVAHHTQIEPLARHVLRNTPNAEHLINEIFSQKNRYASPWVPRSDTKFGIPWL